jgi:ABC-2 type transport system permease protein
MSALHGSLHAELTKAGSARVLWATGVVTIVALAAISAAIISAIRAGRTDLTAKLGPLAHTADWAAFLGAATMVIAAGGILACGIAISWLFGREFSDDTIAGLFGLPASLPEHAGAKLIVYGLFTAALSVGSPLVLLASGLAIGLGPLTASTWVGLAQVAALIGLSAVLALPSAWASTLSRGLLAGVATAVGLLIVAEVGSLAAPVAWFPLTAAALWAMNPSVETASALLTVAGWGVVFVGMTLWSWRRLQLDR